VFALTNDDTPGRRKVAMPQHVHDPRCTGCPHCNAEFRRLLSMTPHEYSAWLTARDASLRLAHQEEKHMTHNTALDDFTPENPYEQDVQRLRAASATPLSDFEARWKAERLRALEAEYAELEARRPPAPRLTDAELESYAPPDSYAADLRVLKAARAQ